MFSPFSYDYASSGEFLFENKLPCLLLFVFALFKTLKFLLIYDLDCRSSTHVQTLNYHSVCISKFESFHLLSILLFLLLAQTRGSNAVGNINVTNGMCLLSTR
jgi:hypothetical protein